MTYKEEFIEFMVKEGALTFGDFTTKSGRKTPYFVNTGNYRTGSALMRLGDYYSDCIAESGETPDALFGPAYKGIPLVSCASAALYRKYGKDYNWCFNRKEIKDHGEGGSLVGYIPKAGQNIAIVEDVVTAGTAVRESLDILKPLGVSVCALYVSVDRMERGQGEDTTLNELRQEFGINVYPIVTVREIIAYLHNRELIGKIYIDDERKRQMEEYLKLYGGKP